MGYLFLDIICSTEQIMSEDQFRSIFSRQMGAIVFIFCATRAVLKFEQFLLENTRSRDAFEPIARKRKYLMDY